MAVDVATAAAWSGDIGDGMLSEPEQPQANASSQLEPQMLMCRSITTFVSSPRS